DALVLVGRYARREHLTYYPAGETVPAHAGSDQDWRELCYHVDGRDRERIVRPSYDIGPFQALRDQPRRKATGVVGSDPAIKRDVRSRWGMVALIDMLKESILRTGCLEIVNDLARGVRLSPDSLAERLMLAIYGYGTNIGIRGVAVGDHTHSEDDLRYVRR